MSENTTETTEPTTASDSDATSEGRTENPAVIAGAVETPGAITPGVTESEHDVPGGAAEAAAVVTGGASSTDVDDDSDDEDANDEESDEAGAATASKRSGRRGQLEREGEVAADFLETLLDICDLDGDLDVDIDGDRAAVALVDSDEGRVPRRLVGPDGQVLEALQELTRLAVQAETGERSRLMLDVAGHRAERRAALVTLAQEAIAGVKASGVAASLEPMTAFERKVVHDEVLAAGLVSESEGAEPRRYVVISPA